MKIEYLQRILIDKLDELKCIYSSDFITEMKNDILNEEDIEKLKELDGFATDGIYLQYFKDNIQKKISPLSLSIFELKNYIKDGEGVRDLGDYENNFHKSGDSVNGVSDSLLGEGKPNEPEEYENNRDNEYSINIELEDDEDDGIDLEDDGIDLDIGSDYWDDFDYNEEPNEEDDTSEEDLVEYNLDDEEEPDEEIDEEPNEEDLVEYNLDDEDDSDEDEIDEDSENDSDDLVEYDLDSDDDSEDEDDDDSDADLVDYSLDNEDNEDLVEYDLDSDDEDLDNEDLDDEDNEDLVEYNLDDEDDSDDGSDDDGLGFEMDSYLDSLLGNNSDTDKNSSDDSDTSNNSAKSNSNNSASQNTLAKPANNTKEKVFNNDFSNNAWDILNGAVDGISKIIRKF